MKDEQSLENEDTNELFEQLIVSLTHGEPLSKTLPVAQELRWRWRLLEHLDTTLKDENLSFWWDKNKGTHVVAIRSHGNTIFMSRRKNPIEILERLREELHAETSKP